MTKYLSVLCTQHKALLMVICSVYFRVTSVYEWYGTECAALTSARTVGHLPEKWQVNILNDTKQHLI